MTKIFAAGVMFLTPDGKALFLKRDKNGDHPGEWCVPGGKVETGEGLFPAAIREVEEEIGFIPKFVGGSLFAVTSLDNVEFTTFFYNVDNPFAPSNLLEHDDWKWSSLKDPPQPLHPGVDLVIKGLSKDMYAQDSNPLALDDNRFKDVDGRLHIKVNNISRACVSPYRGREIPDCKELGLDPERVYKLLRHPDELARAKDSFNNIPLLSVHVPVSAKDPKKEVICGSTGTDAEFNGEFLTNSLVIWDEEDIEGVEKETKKELSCAYRYKADMIPGAFNGETYDGIMRDIIGNHVAIVREGRAGHNVVVGDAALPKLKGVFEMTTKSGSRFAALTKGALLATIAPKLAQDQKVDLNPALAGVTTKNFKERKTTIIEAIKTACDGKLAQDSNLDDLPLLMDALEEVEEEDDDDKKDKGSDKKAKDKKAMDRKAKDMKAACDEDDEDEDDKDKKAKDEDDDEDDKDKKAKDEDDKDKDDDKEKKAMDEKITLAVDTAVSAAVKKTRADMVAVKEAEKAIRPYVGDLNLACDSADEVYAAALTALGVKNVKNIHPSAYSTILSMQPKAGQQKPAHNGNEVAMDAAGMKSFHDRYGHTANIKSA